MKMLRVKSQVFLITMSSPHQWGQLVGKDQGRQQISASWLLVLARLWLHMDSLSGAGCIATT